MALTRDQKQAQVADVAEKMKTAQSVMFAHYIGLSVAEVSDLRKQLKDAGAEMKVAKKTLTKLAAKEAGLPELEDSVMEGAISLIFSFDDPLTGAQVAFKYGKKHDQVSLIGGVFDGQVLTKEQAVELAKMPGRQELLGKFMGMIRSPLNSFAGMCSSPLSGFARALQEMADKGGFGDEPEPEPAPAEEVAPAAEEAKADEAPAEEEKADDAPAEEASAEADTPVEEEKKEEETPEPSPEPADSTDDAADGDAEADADADKTE